MKYMIDDGFNEEYTDSLSVANEIADDMKKKNPLRSVYIGKFTQGVNGDEYDIIAEL